MLSRVKVMTLVPSVVAARLTAPGPSAADTRTRSGGSVSTVTTMRVPRISISTAAVPLAAVGSMDIEPSGSLMDPEI